MLRIGVVGIGNVLMRDDAVGAHVVKRLEASYDLSPEVEVRELGTPGTDLPLLLEGLDVAVVVDAVKMRGAAAGEVRVLDKAELLSKRPTFPATPHDPGLREALFTLEFCGGGPGEVRLVGVSPGAVEGTVGLTREVADAVPAALAEVLRQLAAFGVTARARAVPAAPDLWWEQRP